MIALVRSPHPNEYGYKAGIVLAQALIKEGRTAEGVEVLKSVPADSGPYRDLANYYMAIVAGQNDNQNK
jgi:hypothetical protein